MKRWYAVYCHPHREFWARANLWERSFEVYLPQYLKVRRHARRTDRVRKPLFPNYLFVLADLSDGDKPRINTAPGIRSLVQFDEHSPLIADRVIEELKAREDDDGLINVDPSKHMNAGDQVNISIGPLRDTVGLFKASTDHQRVVLLIQMLGRQVQVTVPFDQVQL